jgi:hypothetical protein
VVWQVRWDSSAVSPPPTYPLVWLCTFRHLALWPLFDLTTVSGFAGKKALVFGVIALKWESGLIKVVYVNAFSPEFLGVTCRYCWHRMFMGG